MISLLRLLLPLVLLSMLAPSSHGAPRAGYLFRPAADGRLPDTSGNGHDATARLDGDAGWIDTERGPALQLQQENDWVELPPDAFPGPRGSVQITFRPEEGEGRQHLLRLYHPHGDGLTLYLNNGELILRYYYRAGNETFVARLPAGVVKGGEWTTATANWELDEHEWSLSVQVDPQRKAGAKRQALAAPEFPPGSRLVIGNEHAGGSPFLGALFSVELFDEPQEVAEAAPTPLPELVTIPKVERQRLLPRTLFFSRTQPKYNLHVNPLLRLWTDRPLFFDRRTGESPRPYEIVSAKSFLKVQEAMLDYGLDGTGALVGYMPFQGTAFDEMRQALDEAKPKRFVPLILEVSGVADQQQAQRKLELFLPLAKAMQASPHALRVNGKLLILSYALDSGPLEAWSFFMHEVRKALGDDFLFIADMTTRRPALLREFNERSGVSAATLADFKAHLRAWLEQSDGIMWAAGSHTNHPDGRLQREFYREFLVPTFRSVLAEAPFRGKLFGLDAEVGYINVMTSRTSNWEENTARLRDNLEIALEAQPDFVTLPEWDELNENTSVGPTLTNSLTTGRILRYYRHRFHGTPHEPQPGEDASIPNLIVSARPYLRVGEIGTLELLHLPEAGSGKVSAELALENSDGEVVQRFDPVTFASAQAEAHTFSFASESLAAHALLRPVINLTHADGTRSRWKDGLETIRLLPSWNLNEKVTKIALRDLLLPERVSFEVRPGKEGRVEVEASVLSDEPIASIEIVQDSRELYAFDPSREHEPAGDEALVMLQWQAMRNPQNFHGTLSVRDGELRRFIAWRRPEYKLASYHLEAKADEQGRLHVPFTTDAGVNSTNARGGFFFISQPEKAVLVMESDRFKLEVPVREILEKGHLAKVYQGGLTVELRRPDLLIRPAMPLLQKEATFTTTVTPWRRDTPLQMRIVTVSGKIYRSQPLLSFPKGEKRPLPVWSETAQKVVQIEAQALPSLRPRLHPTHGQALPMEDGFTALVGGVPFDMAAFAKSQLATAYPAGAPETAPQWVTEEGQDALRFDGRGNFLYFPEESLPRGAFTLEMELKVTSQEKQLLATSRGYRRGALTLQLIRGEPVVQWIDHRGKLTEHRSGLSVPLNQWSRLSVSYDLEKLTLRVDGREAHFPLPERGAQTPTPLIIGGYGNGKGLHWFSGFLRHIALHHYPL